MADERDDFMREYLEITPEQRIEYLTQGFGAPVARAMRRAYAQLTTTWMARRDRLPKPLIVNNEFHDTGTQVTFLLTAMGLPPVEVLYLSAWNGNYAHHDRERRRGFNPDVPFAHQPVLDWIEQTFKDSLASVEAWEAAKRNEQEAKARAQREAVERYRAMMGGEAS